MGAKGNKARVSSESSIFKIHERFLRSTHLERDWNDPTALDNYVFTLQAAHSLERLTRGLKKSSSLRAWRITGDYGSGKSSFALLTANVFSKRLKSILPSLKTAVLTAVPDLSRPSFPKLIPILVTGSRESLGSAILKSLLKTLNEVKVQPSFYSKFERFLQQSKAPTDNEVLDWLKTSNEQIVKSANGDGMALILDEAGKFLEQAAMRPDQQDIFLLQALAEMASRSAKTPFYIISIFHQGVSSYTEELSKGQQREWEKIAGRYEEIIWHYPVDQTVTLIANSLLPDLNGVPRQVISALKKDMQEAIQLSWYGLSLNTVELAKNAEQLYPIHPTIIPILVKLFANYGQNERSLYSFLLGMEPFGLQDFVSKTKGKKIFRLADLYDYARSTFGSRLGAMNYHWKSIDALVKSFEGDQGQSQELLKTIGIINLINSADLIASKGILSLAIGGDVSKALSKLETNHHLHYRGREGGYCVWPNTSVNLHEAYEIAKQTLGISKEFKTMLRSRLETRPIVARRHYIETGTLRYFEVRYVDVGYLEGQVNEKYDGDGVIVVPLCESPKDVRRALDFAKTMTSEEFNNVLFVIPPPLQHLTSYLDEVRRWEWIERSIGELRHDRFAREEVSRQLSLREQELHNHIQATIGLTSVGSDESLTWYQKGKVLPGLHSGKEVMSLLSDICNANFGASPRIHNELINRKELSSAGASARLRLCERLFEFSTQPFLGMDSEAHPPEMSMYLSVLKEAGFHKAEEDSGFWSVTLPERHYDRKHCHVLPTMECIHRTLTKNSDQRLPVLTLFDTLRRPPYGVKDGLIPLFLAVFAVIHEQELAFYEDGSFIARVSGSNFLRLIKAPETFELQYYPITGVRSVLFQKLAHELGFKSTKTERIDILDVVKPLMIFMSGLPEYVLNTSHLSPQAQAVRAVLRTTVDPVDLLFRELPRACGTEIARDQAIGESEGVKSFVVALKASIDELRGAYPALLEQIGSRLFNEFNVSESFEENRTGLSERAKSISGFITEIGLKSFCLRLADQQLGKDLWLESLGNLLCSMPPSKWRDRDSYKFDQEIHKFVSQFLRVEATLFKKLKNSDQGLSVRVALTRPNGEERDQVIHLTIAQAKTIAKVEAEVKTLLSQYGQVGMAAASEVLWEMMTVDQVKGS